MKLNELTEFYARARDPEKPPGRCNIAVYQQAVPVIYLKTSKRNKQIDDSNKQYDGKKKRKNQAFVDYTNRQQQTTTGLKYQEKGQNRRKREKYTKKRLFFYIDVLQ